MKYIERQNISFSLENIYTNQFLHGFTSEVKLFENE